MADTSPKKKVAAKPKKPAAHPKYILFGFDYFSDLE
jgi:hypothetical protein